MKIKRVIILEGKPEWIEKTLEHSLVDPKRSFHTPHGVIREKSRTVYEEREEES